MAARFQRPRAHPSSRSPKSSAAEFSSHRRLGTDPTRASLWPPREAELAAVFLNKPTNHPTVYRKRIMGIEGKPQAGEWVSVYHSAGELGQPELFAYGLYNPKSEIAVRLVRWSAELPDEAFWNQLLDRAVSLRTHTLGLDSLTNAYRVLHAEADGFPGLVVDRYADCLSAEIFSFAMASRVPQILERLAARLGTKHWLIQPSPHLESQEGYNLEPQASPQLPAQVVIEEQGTKYRVHFGTGHKTGFFCDQRDNRWQLAQFCRGRSVLDICCYTGGFAIMAATAGGASQVVGVDLDEAPLRFAKQNATLNGVQVKFTQADAFAYLRDLLRVGKSFDVVILDPPKLIRNRSEIESGTRKHFDLNRLAMQLVNPGGVMLSCTCAGLLSATDFERLVCSASRTAFLPSELNPHPVPRQMQILARSGAAACHPVSGNCLETEYLKGLWLRL